MEISAYYWDTFRWWYYTRPCKVVDRVYKVILAGEVLPFFFHIDFLYHRSFIATQSSWS